MNFSPSPFTLGLVAALRELSLLLLLLLGGFWGKGVRGGWCVWGGVEVGVGVGVGVGEGEGVGDNVGDIVGVLIQSKTLQ